MKILLVEDERITRIAMRDNLSNAGHNVTICADGEEGLLTLKKKKFDLVITDLKLPNASGLDILAEAKNIDGLKVIIMTAFATVENAIEALRLGAYDYLIKPFAPEELLNIVENLNDFHKVVKENRKLKERIDQHEARDIIGQSPAMIQMKQTIEIASDGDYTVLVEGESGTGKELVARAIHRRSSRKKKPFVAINCCAIPETLFESELFGHVRGAFSGADKNHAGYFERAKGGVLFIDDIDDMQMNLQAKILRVIQEREIERVGGNQSIPIDIRIIAATKKDLKQLVAEGKFRDDLYYRLNVVPISIPKLSDRKDDIQLLVEHFLKKHGAPQEFVISPEILPILMRYDWPGNVRELENIVERIIALPSIDLSDILIPQSNVVDDVSQYSDLPTFPLNLHEYVTEFENSVIDKALEHADNNLAATARILQIPRSTLRSKLEKR